MNFHDPGSGLKPRNSGLKGPHTYAQPFLTSNGTWPTSLLFLQKQKIGAELHIYLEEGTYYKRLFRGPNTNDMKK